MKVGRLLIAFVFVRVQSNPNTNLDNDIEMNAIPSNKNLMPLGRVVINRKQLLKKVPLCERTILDMEKRGEFPKRFSVTRRLVGWDLAEIDEWIARQQNSGIQQPQPGTKKS
jgi:prophage regulatory protein